MMTTIERYRALRRDDPYLPAKVAWPVAQSATLAESAGVRSWAHEDVVTIEGDDYLLSVEDDAEGWSWDGDCFGTVHDRRRTDWGYPAPVAWPCVPLPAGGDNYVAPFVRGEGTYYDPGPHWEPYAPKGMARGPRHEYVRRGLIREGVMIRDTREKSVTLTDPEDGGVASLCGVGLGEGDTWERSYLYEVATELAAEIQDDRAARIEKQKADAERAALESLSASMLAALIPT